jgi:hypothetical protein
MRRNETILWLSQIALPGAVAAYTLFLSRFGPAPGDLLWLATGGACLWVIAAAMVLVTSRARQRVWLRVGLSLWLTAVTWSLGMCSLVFAGMQVDILPVVWKGKPGVSEWEKIGIITEHPRYGWWHIPGAVGRHKHWDFNVVYTIDNDGFRVTSSPTKVTKDVLCLGGSDTFGHGVSDNEVFPAVLADQYWTGLKVRNGGCMAWGAGQAFLLTKDYFANHKAPAMVFYCWSPGHARRSSLRKSWLNVLDRVGRRNPHFEIENDSLVFRGLAGVEEGLPESPELRWAEFELSVRLLVEMGRVCQEKAVPFYLVLLPYWRPTSEWDSLTDGIATEVGRKGVRCIDVRSCIQDLPANRLYFPHDTHPRPVWHERVAQALAEAKMIPGGN